MISAALIRHSQKPTKRDNKTTEGEELGEKLEYFLTRKPLAMRLRKMILPHPFFFSVCIANVGKFFNLYKLHSYVCPPQFF